MSDSIEIFDNQTKSRTNVGCDTSAFSTKEAALALAFHRSIPRYAPTALHSLPAFADSHGFFAVWLKDESSRFGLNAFKGLGASYAIALTLARRLNTDHVTFSELTSEEARNAVGNVVFATATDGNHGRGVAWAAQQMGQRAAVFLPSHAAPFRVERIRSHGADVTVTDVNYDASVRLVAAAAENNHWELIQDTAWEGYVDVPTWIMRGYLTMFAEALEQLEDNHPTHVFIQAGVGSLAGALQGYLIQRYGSDRPLLAVVEPKAMASYYTSVLADDGQSHTIGDAHDETIMACLAAGENSPLSWPILRDYGDFFVRCEDNVTEHGMRSLAQPTGSDPRVVAGESGAVTTGVVARAGRDKCLANELQLDADSKVLLFVTEGAGDPTRFRKITGTAI